MNAPATPLRLAPFDPLATLAITGSTVVTAVSMHRVFFDWSFLPPLLAVVIAVHVAAAVLRAFRAPTLIALPLLALTSAAIFTAVYYGSSLDGVRPTSSTLDLVRADLTAVLEEFATAVAPVASDGSFAAMSAAVLMLCAILADSFAFRAGGRSEALVPGAAMFVIVSVTGVDRHRVLFATAWIAVAIATVGLLRARQQRADFTRMRGRRTRSGGAQTVLLPLALVASLIGGWLGPRLPGADDEALIRTRTPVDSITEVISPLVDIRAQLRDRSNRELFVAELTGTPRYWRLVSLPDFDGAAWNPPEEDLVDLDDAPAAPWAATASVTFEQRLLIRGLGGPLVPSAYLPSDVESDDVDVYWAADSESLVAPRGGLETDDRLRITATAPVLTTDQLRAASATGAPAGYTDLPPLPAAIAQTALAVTAEASTDFDRAMALQQWFRSQFVYDTEVDFGNSGSAIERFLDERRGFCQQFAGTFAVMARLLGMPSRVAVGFTPGQRDAIGRYHVYGRDAHAWPEVWFGGVGWVAFEPTPGRDGGAAGDYLGIEPGPDDSVPPEATTPESSAPTTTLDRTTVVAPTSTLPNGAPTSVAADDGDPGLPVDSPAFIVLAVVTSALLAAAVWRSALVPVIVRRRMRALSRRSASERTTAHWRRAARCLEVRGVPNDPTTTPLEFARSAAAMVDDPTPVERLALLATRAAFSATATDDTDAATALRLADSIERSCRMSFTGTQRWRATMDPWFLTPRRVDRRRSDSGWTADRQPQ